MPCRIAGHIPSFVSWRWSITLAYSQSRIFLAQFFNMPHSITTRSLLLLSKVAIAVNLICLLSHTLQARSAAIPPADCGPGVKLRASALQAQQGTLLSTTLSTAKPLGDFKATWDATALPFWTARPWKAGRTELREALFGIDLEKAPGNYELAVSGQLQSGEPFSCKILIKVMLGHYATESLKVSKQFVEPDEAQVKRANAERDTLRAIYEHVTPEQLWAGPFRPPLDNVKTGGNFGKRRILNGIPGSPHAGVDFPSPTGTPIHATQAGKVVLAQELFFAGNCVIIDHGFGIYTLYGHMSQMDVHSGDVVTAGQILGKVGATGRVTGPHLHWGLSVNRSRVNSLDLLKLLGAHPR
jgi:murein DD-endopeptidase MepM/ murein hydrolase activator NlpD